MDFDVTPEDTLLRDSVRRALAATDAQHAWPRCVALGLAGLDLRERTVTAEDALAMTIVQEEIGRALLPTPFVTTVVQAMALVRDASPATARAIEVGAIVATADAGSDVGYGRSARPICASACESGWRLDGEQALVDYADRAEAIVLCAHADGGDAATLFLVPAGVRGLTVAAVRRLDDHPAADLALTGVLVPDSVRLGPVGAGGPLLESARRMALVALVAEAVGCMDALLALTLDYLRTRRQFGRALSEFQALQHRAADMYVAIEQARSMMLFAALNVSNPDVAARACAVAAAKVQAGRSARVVGQQAIQLHGGIGLADENRAGHYFQRLTAIELACGDADQHLASLGERGGLYGAGEAIAP